MIKLKDKKIITVLHFKKGVLVDPLDCSDCTQLFAYWEILHAFLLSADFFKINFFKKFFWGISFECQTNWIHIRPNILSGLIWIQTVCKSFLQTALGGKELTQGAVLCICSHF